MASENIGQSAFQFLKAGADIADDITHDFAGARHLIYQPGNLPATDLGFICLTEILRLIWKRPPQDLPRSPSSWGLELSDTEYPTVHKYDFCPSSPPHDKRYAP